MVGNNQNHENQNGGFREFRKNQPPSFNKASIRSSAWIYPLRALTRLFKKQFLTCLNIIFNLFSCIAEYIPIYKSFLQHWTPSQTYNPHTKLFLRCILKDRAFMAMHVYPNFNEHSRHSALNPIGTASFPHSYVSKTKTYFRKLFKITHENLY
jgi:hypothetical protein